MVSKKFNSVEVEMGVVKKWMKLNDEELRVDVSDDFVDNLDFDDLLLFLLFLFLLFFEDSDNGEFMDDNEDNFVREIEGGYKGFEDGMSELLFEMNNLLMGVYVGFGS